MLQYWSNKNISSVAFVLLTFALTSYQVQASHHCRPGDSCTALHKAALKGDHHELNQLLQEWTWRAQINKTNSGRFTPLDLAVQEGHVTIVQTLLSAGADVNHIINKDTYTSTLDMALIQSNKDIIKRILPRVNRQNLTRTLTRVAEGQRYLFLYTVLKKLDNSDIDVGTRTMLLAQLLSHRFYNDANKNYAHKAINKLFTLGVDRHFRNDFDGNTLLHQAIQANHTPFIDQLIKLGLEIDLTNNNHQTALSIAISNKYVEAAEALIEYGAKVDKVISKNVRHYGSAGAPLSLAINKNLPLDFIKYLLKKGAQVHVDDIHEALNMVSYSQDTKLVEALIEHSASIDENNNGDKSLILLALEKNLPLTFITYLHQHGASIDHQDQNGNTPLHQVLKQDKQLDSAKFLITNGTDVNKVNNAGKTPLFMAIDNKLPLSIIADLLEKGADVNKADKKLMTPLHLVLNEDKYYFSTTRSSEDQETLLNLLIDSQADVNALNAESMSPLLMAVKNQLPLSIIEHLIDNGADVNQADDGLNTPLCLALQQKNEPLAYLLLQHDAQADRVTSTETTPLLLALENDMSLPLITELLSSGAAINQANQQGLTPLHVVLEQRQFGKAHLLIANGANVQALTTDRKTPLHYLCAPKAKSAGNSRYFRSKESDSFLLKHNSTHTPKRFPVKLVEKSNLMDVEGMIKMLLDHGAQLNAPDDKQQTPLHLAIQHSQTTALYLVKHNADINQADKAGLTPLHQALRQGDFDLAVNLIKKGANVLAVMNNGETTLHSAFTRGSSKALLKITHDKQNSTASGLLVQLVKKGVPLNAMAEYVSPVLHLALEKQNQDAAHYLIIKGADVNSHHGSGETPLFLAISKKSNHPLVKILLKKGADPNLSYQSHNCFGYAWQKKYGAIAELLLNHGAVPYSFKKKLKHSYQSKYITPLWKAIKANEPRIVRGLLKHGAEIQNDMLTYVLDKKSPQRRSYDATDSWKSTVLALNKNSDHKKSIAKDTENRQLAICQLLLRYGADPNLPNQEGDYPLTLALLSDHQPQIHFVKPLFDAGANLYVASYQGRPLIEELQTRNLLKFTENCSPVPSLFWLAYKKTLLSFRGDQDNMKELEQALLMHPGIGDLRETHFKEFVITNQTDTDEHYIAQWLQQLKTQKQQAQAQQRQQEFEHYSYRQSIRDEYDPRDEYEYAEDYARDCGYYRYSDEVNPWNW